MKPGTSLLPGQHYLIIKLLLITAGLYFTNHELITRLTYYTDFRLYFPLAVFLGIWITSLIAIFYIAFTPRTAERVAWSAVICCAVFLGETYYQVTSNRLQIGKLDAMWDTGLFTADIVAFYGNYFFLALIHTVPLLVGLLIPVPSMNRLRWRGLVLIPLVPLLLCSGLVYHLAATDGWETKAMPSQFLIPGIFIVYGLSSPPSQEKSPVDIPIINPSGLRHIILMVDESVSGDFIDLNTPRGTTPFLLSQADSIANFGLAVSASNCSNASNAILRMGAKPDRLGTSDYPILSNPTIWKYARDAGFETNFLEAQNISKLNNNFMHRPELELIDHIETIFTGTATDQRDLKLIKMISTILSRPRPQFIYVNKAGVHFPYQNYFPADETVFTPSMGAYETIGNRELLVNTYKNAIHWSVDHFFESLFAEIELSDSVLVYTSDHGQNLLDDGRPTTHCRRSQENLYEAVVPLLVWTGNEQLSGKFIRAAEMNHGKTSHFEIFPTILQLFGYDSKLIRQRYHQGLFEKIDKPLGFTSGPVMGRFGRPATWHSREGLDRLKR